MFSLAGHLFAAYTHAHRRRTNNNSMDVTDGNPTGERGQSRNWTDQVQCIRGVVAVAAAIVVVVVVAGAAKTRQCGLFFLEGAAPAR